MSTLPGQASKAEKTKSKFQSLDINSLYRVSRGENLEKQQQKSSSVYIKHGMQSLGKVPNARRAPANLPSLKAEHSGSDAAVPLVPPGAQGWGKQDANAAQPSQSTPPANPPSQNSAAPVAAATTAASPNQPPANPQLSPHQAAIALPVTNPIPHPHKQLTPSAQPAPVDKLWSSVMSGQDVPHPPLYQSPQFQHEFPSLSVGDGVPTRTGSDAPQYPSGLSLRPQTEGSWTQGGTRPAGQTSGGDPAGRPGSCPQGVAAQHSAQAGQQQPQTTAQQQQPFPPQMRGVMPSFMYKGSGFQQQAPGGGVHGAPTQANGRSHRGGEGRHPRPGGPDRGEADDALPRPIIKEEELTRMDEIGKDMGWAAESDEIDYNQKLAFSDDETDNRKRESKRRQPSGREHKEEHPGDAQARQWGGGARANAAPRVARPAEEEDVWTQRRNQTDKEVELAVQRAKQRKEEEEKRFQEERKQAAAKKLMELEEKIQKRDRDNTHHDASPPALDKEHTTTANSEPCGGGDDKGSPSGGNSFRQLTQIEGKNFPTRKHAKPVDREGREPNAPFSKNFQNDLPPRFLKHQRNSGNSNPQQQQQQQFDGRWSQQEQPSARPQHADADGKLRDKDDDKRQPKEKAAVAASADWGERRDGKGREDWSDRRSNGAEKARHPRDFLVAWSSEGPPYEREERKREDRRAVPGPITRERIEADDVRGEKRNLTQLRRGQPVEVRSEMKRPEVGEGQQQQQQLEQEEEKNKKESQFASAWADSIPAAIEEQAKKMAEGQQKVAAVVTEPAKKQQDKPPPSSYGPKKGWGNNAPGGDYHQSRGQPWQGRRPHSRSRRSGGRAEYHGGTESDGSPDDHANQKSDARNDGQAHKSEADHHHQQQQHHQQKSPRPTRRNDRDKFGKPAEKRENYVPRGEPSRHGRGGGNFRSGRMASMSKKIDGYGPPPAKSPFGGHHDDNNKEKKPDEAVTVAVESAATSAEDKIKQNQQALAAGIIGKRSDPPAGVDDKVGGGSKARPKPEARKGGNKPNEVAAGSEDAARKQQQGGKVNGTGGGGGGRTAPAPNRGGRAGNQPNPKQAIKRDDKSAAADVAPAEDKSESGAVSSAGDSEGFQEVKSKKTAVKERQKSSEDKSKAAAVAPKVDAKPPDRKSKTQQLTQQQIQNIPPLMATPVNPPPILPKSGFDRGRQTSKLPPRFAKQKLQKQAAMQQQQQQQHHLCDLNDMSKVNQNAFGMREATAPTVTAPACAWDKPLGSQLRSAEHDLMLGVVAVDAVAKGPEPSQPNPIVGDKTSDKPLLDGSSAPVNTIIFENTNFKSAPGVRAPPPQRGDKPRPKLDEPTPNAMDGGFGKTNVSEMLQAGKGDGKAAATDAMQLPLFKADAADMKIDFFSTDLQFSDDKASKNFVAKSIHAITSGNNTVDTLDIKIASVKKVWETSEQEGEDNQIAAFGGAPLDSNVFNQSKDASEDSHEGYSPSAAGNQSAQTNVCKVKPTQQVSGGGQTAMGSGHQPHAGMVAAGLMGNPLSPPPIPPVLGAGVGMGPQYTANQHMGYQTGGLSGSTQYGISAIPSPPTVPLVYNSSQQLQSAVQTAGLYGAFQLDQLGGQGRSQFSQYANYHGLGQTASSPYSTPSVYLPTPPHPPPPPAAQPPPPELYQNINNFRLSATTPFGQNQQLNNPTTVLISSTSNSLMSASVKPSGQQISAIGTKAGGVGQAYQQQSQQGQQVFMTYDPSMQANYLASNAGVMQRAPVGPAQNNVVPGLQPSSSYYSGSTGGQTGFFQQPGNSAQMSQHQAGYGLQGNVFGTHNQSHTNTALQNYNSHFLTAPMQVAAALNAQQQFRSNLPYMKGVGDQSGRSQQLKSPSSQEVLSSVFNSGPQIPSPKSRQNMKHPPQQSSPTSQHKFNMYQQGVGGGPPNMNMQRYPTPIQRPINFQQMQQNSVNQKHRNNPNSNKPSNNRYYGNQNHSLSGQSEKCDDAKMDGGANASGAAKGVVTGADGVKENLKEEAVALKD